VECVSAVTYIHDLVDGSVGPHAPSSIASQDSIIARATYCRLFAQALAQCRGPNVFETRSRGGDHVDRGDDTDRLAQRDGGAVAD
jgi:hypothetical protein